MTHKSTTSIANKHDSIHLGRGLRVQFQRTLRIPDDGKTYPLPPGFGAFPVRRVDDYLDRVPDEWRDRGGVFVPMYQREAMWILFQGEHWKPRAVKIGIGKVCAITGERWSESLAKQRGRGAPQNYVVTPPQPWLDGICSGRGTIRQFVAMPLGMGYTVEGQVTGEERFGGIQLKVFEPRPGRFPDRPPQPRYRASGAGSGMMMGAAAPAAPRCAPAPASKARAGKAGAMGLAAGAFGSSWNFRRPAVAFSTSAAQLRCQTLRWCVGETQVENVTVVWARAGNASAAPTTASANLRTFDMNFSSSSEVLSVAAPRPSRAACPSGSWSRWRRG